MRHGRFIVAALSSVLVVGVLVIAASSANVLQVTHTVTATTTIYENVEILGTCVVTIVYPRQANYTSTFATSYYANETTLYVTTTTRSLTFAVDYTACTYTPRLP